MAATEGDVSLTASLQQRQHLGEMSSKILQETQTNNESQGSFKESSQGIEEMGFEVENNLTAGDESKNIASKVNEDHKIEDGAELSENRLTTKREGQKDSNFWKSLHSLHITDESTEQEKLNQDPNVDTHDKKENMKNVDNHNSGTISTENIVAFDGTPIIDEDVQKTELVMRRTPHPMNRLDVLKKQEFEDVTNFSVQPSCNSPREDKEDLEEDEELRKLSWDSESDERTDLGLEDGTAMKVQVLMTDK